jgi:hypothetical protein
MAALVNALDAYERQARQYPMLLVLLPAVLGAASWVPAGVDVGGLLGGALTSVVLAAFLGQIARDQGKRREPELFRKWGCKPSVMALSYEAQFFDAKTLRRIHRSLHDIDNELMFPESAEEEAAKRESAFAAYESASELLLSRTRDRERFRLVFRENVNYGYRRNLWAMKVPGMTLAVLGVGASVGRLVQVAVMDSPLVWTALVGGVIGVALGSMWVIRVREGWVRIAADAFARQLCLAAQSIAKGEA